MLVEKPRGEPARVRLVLIDVHPERPRIADARDADRRWRRLVGDLAVAITVGVELNRPPRIRSELLGQARREPPQETDPVRLTPHGTEYVDIGSIDVRHVPPKEQVVVNQNVKLVEPRRSRPVFVAE